VVRKGSRRVSQIWNRAPRAVLLALLLLALWASRTALNALPISVSDSAPLSTGAVKPSSEGTVMPLAGSALTASKRDPGFEYSVEDEEESFDYFGFLCEGKCLSKFGNPWYPLIYGQLHICTYTSCEWSIKTWIPLRYRYVCNYWCEVYQ
jgi:hypothetical protein